MESSQVFGGEEGCHSSESGWTMYIGSPVQGEDDDSDPNGHVAADGEAEEFDEEKWETNHDENSDDSMASDASSGPSLREKTWEIKKGVRHEAKVGRSHCSQNKEKEPVRKNRHEKRNEEKKAEGHEVAAKGAKYLVQGGKVRKNLGWGKQAK